MISRNAAPSSTLHRARCCDSDSTGRERLPLAPSRSRPRRRDGAQAGESPVQGTEQLQSSSAWAPATNRRSHDCFPAPGWAESVLVAAPGPGRKPNKPLRKTYRTRTQPTWFIPAFPCILPPRWVHAPNPRTCNYCSSVRGFCPPLFFYIKQNKHTQGKIPPSPILRKPQQSTGVNKGPPAQCWEHLHNRCRTHISPSCRKCYGWLKNIEEGTKEDSLKKKRSGMTLSNINTNFTEWAESCASQNQLPLPSRALTPLRPSPEVCQGSSRAEPMPS